MIITSKKISKNHEIIFNFYFLIYFSYLQINYKNFIILLNFLNKNKNIYIIK